MAYSHLRRFTLALCGAAVLVAASGSCATADKPGDLTADEPDAMPPPGAGQFSEGGDGKVVVVPGCDVHCSADLHTVLDCDDKLIETCSQTQGCAKGGCVAACESAKANNSNLGCDYYAGAPDIPDEGNTRGACFAAFVANTWSTPITIAVERGGKALDVKTFARIPSGVGQNMSYSALPNGQLPPGQVAILFLASMDGALAQCPPGIAPAVSGAVDAAVHGTAIGQAFHVTTSAPVVAYDIFPYGAASSAFTSASLLLPTSAWGKNYVAVSAYKRAMFVSGGQPTLDIVAAEDGTNVTIRPALAIVAGAGVQAAPIGQPKTYALSKGQVLQFTQNDELTGSPIESNKPIAVFGGSSFLNINVSEHYADTAHQQIPPVSMLGFEYAAVRYRNRRDGVEETPPWRLVGAVDGTVLTYEPSAPSGAPTTLSSGQVAEFTNAGPFVVKSQDASHPFYMAAYMTSGNFQGGYGDPDFVNVVPPRQFLSSYVFFTDGTFPETNLVVVRKKGKTGGFKDVILDCAGPLTGWAPLGNAGELEFTRKDLVRHNFAKQGNCDNGRHEMKSDAPFGVTVWGWGSPESIPVTSNVSYAYPAGMGVEPINTVVVPTGPR